MTPDLLVSWNREEKGIPIGRAPEVNLRNNHLQYIVTWYVSTLIQQDDHFMSSFVRVH
jgi:surfeit locus 1 family protein